MRIRCLDCGHSEEVTTDLFVKIVGGATAGFGFWAWVSFLFAGTGFALPICIAIIAGGGAMLAYKEKIVDWLVNNGLECDGCGSQKWSAVSLEVEKEINAQKTKIASLEKEAQGLAQNFVSKEKEAYEYVKEQDSSFSMEDVEDLLDQLEQKESRIESLLKDQEEWESLKSSFHSAQDKLVGNLKTRFNACYSSLVFSKASLKRIARLEEAERLKLEQQLGFLQHNPTKTNFRDDIIGTDVKEIGFGTGGRMYIRKEGSKFNVVCVGNKNTQKKDLKQLKSAYKES